jgi:hypothetical protein
MTRLNWKIILSNIAEAREQLEEIEARVKNEKKPDEIELQILLEHAYHHLNFAWNIRHIPTKRYSKLSDGEFNQWSKIPKEIEEYKLEKEETKKSRTKK